MANAQRGEVSLTVGERTYTLVLNLNAQAEIEAALSAATGHDVTWDQFQQKLSSPKLVGVRDLRLLIWGMTRKHHSALTLSQVGDLIDEVGLDRLTGVMTATGQAANPDPQDVEALGLARARPRRAQARKRRDGEG